jgi:hypothetical protein
MEVQISLNIWQIIGISDSSTVSKLLQIYDAYGMLHSMTVTLKHA